MLQNIFEAITKIAVKAHNHHMSTTEGHGICEGI